MNPITRSQLRHSTLDTRSKGRTKPTVSADYIVGLTDGEGCFYVNVWNTPSYRAGSSVQLHFHIKLQATDKIILDKVRKTLGCGAVYFQKEQRANHSQCYRYTVFARRDIMKIIIPFFRRHNLQGVSKKKSFELFCKIAQLVESKEHLTQEGLQKISFLKAQMNNRTAGLA